MIDREAMKWDLRRVASKIPLPSFPEGSIRVKRQEDKKEESFESEICKDKDAGEWFRLVAGEGDNCRDVIQCTSSGLQAIRCPAGLYFDIDKQTCDWKDSVNNCKLKNKERKAKPLLYTEEPLCQDGFLACGDGSCIERGLFCNGEKDCGDGSDENICGKLATELLNDASCARGRCILKIRVTILPSILQTWTTIPTELHPAIPPCAFFPIASARRMALRYPAISQAKTYHR